MSTPGVGRVQLRIMKVLWDRKQATAREITDALNEDEPIAHSTVQTLLRKLEAKGVAAHKAEGRTFLFHATIKEQKVVRKATRDLLERVFGGNAAGLVAYLLKNERIEESELEEIRRLIGPKSKK